MHDDVTLVQLNRLRRAGFAVVHHDDGTTVDAVWCRHGYSVAVRVEEARPAHVLIERVGGECRSPMWEASGGRAAMLHAALCFARSRAADVEAVPA